jgi:hypothetical protein
MPARSVARDRLGLHPARLPQHNKRASILRATKEGLALWQEGQARRAAPLANRIETLADPELHQLESLLPLLQRVAEPPGTD